VLAWEGRARVLSRVLPGKGEPRQLRGGAESALEFGTS